MSSEFDYIVIGSGAAGSVVAARLAQAQVGSICVIEAGGDNHKWLVDIPAGFVRNLQNPSMMWQFETEPTENTGGRRVYLPQGKILGGSTSINGLVYNRGQAEDFDQWALAGNTGWSYQELLPYFRKSETFGGSESQFRGSTGPLRISEPEQSHPLCDSFIGAVAGLTGVPKHNDYNGKQQTGTGYYQRFIHKGKRENAAAGFLNSQIAKKRVTLMTNTLVTRIGFENGRAVNVEVIREGATAQITARKEILVSAGTINSAALLQRSGIGDAEHLQSLETPVIKHLPGPLFCAAGISTA